MCHTTLFLRAFLRVVVALGVTACGDGVEAPADAAGSGAGATDGSAPDIGGPPDHGAQIGEPCHSERRCVVGAFCEFPEGTCDDASITGICEPMPTDCAMETRNDADAVCGCGGQTWVNDCERRKLGQRRNRAGRCVGANDPCVSHDDCQFAGEYCEPIEAGQDMCGVDGFCRMGLSADICPDVIRPVCGCDGVVYDNMCLAQAAGAGIRGASELCTEE